VSAHRYSASSVRGDYLRCAAGLVLCGGPLIAAPMGTVGLIIFGALTLLFVVYGARTWERQHTAVTEDERGLSTSGPRQASVAWRELEHLTLSFFATRKSKGEGWMQLSLRGGGQRLKVDSHLDGFDGIARRALNAARENGVELSPATLANYAALGLDDEGGWGAPSTWRPDGPSSDSPSSGGAAGGDP